MTNETVALKEIASMKESQTQSVAAAQVVAASENVEEASNSSNNQGARVGLVFGGCAEAARQVKCLKDKK